jgi:hypothetical protein
MVELENCKEKSDQGSSQKEIHDMVEQSLTPSKVKEDLKIR